jgi:hypothetical protein
MGYVDNWHRYPPFSKLLCKVGRHDMSFLTHMQADVQAFTLECFRCGHQARIEQVVDKVSDKDWLGWSAAWIRARGEAVRRFWVKGRCHGCERELSQRSLMQEWCEGCRATMLMEDDYCERCLYIFNGLNSGWADGEKCRNCGKLREPL